ncbi:subclass B1 metallo-beta-lactamase [Aquimarina sp. 2201CG5-10]|uniref:subclass B1 metallo-beta-lactamase n=1 Tax=Aquimarina callyspongiae TaxID=3098150 RepID=UPI002AB487AA|nr:subclass B1 metallo-beta-lactamase [Aquimarina sp. 2201CG5-10]MDY8138208.1 subclass B1 metallo-beta-lactamase [Aquimarina sp. 2201CG5-10]
MASIFAHGFTAYALGKTFSKEITATKFWILGIVCAILPDADVISFAFGIPYEDFWGHRGFSHSLVFALLLGIVITFLFYNRKFFSKTGFILILYFMVCTASHGVLDAMTTGGLGIAFFSPFDDTRYFFPWRPIQVSPIGASKFFSKWGIKVLLSELIWIGIPGTIYILVTNQLRQNKQKKTNLKNNVIKKIILVTTLLVTIISCKKKSTSEVISISPELTINKLSDHNYIHISTITLSNGKKFPCNGFVYVNNNEAYIFDSPATDQATTELINWLRDEKHLTVKGVVFNHFHSDCTKGIDIFKEQGISTIASHITKTLMINEGYTKPDTVFKNQLELTLGSKKIINTFFGGAHTHDNIVSFFPEENLIFGGCMIKSLNAKKGNLADANLADWSKTVSKIKEAYPNLQIVIPGHGDHGDMALLDYTISLFKTE